MRWSGNGRGVTYGDNGGRISGGAVRRLQEDPLLAVLCEAAEAAWESRLDPGVTKEDCGGALRCAAAFMAAADYMGKRCRAESFTVGEVTVRQSGGRSAAVMAETLRQTAERLMRPYAASGEFCFRGVRG